MRMALRARQWTLADLDRLPDDGNRYELIRGELVVTPAPTPAHESVLVRVSDLLWPFVREHALGSIHAPRSVIVIGEEQVEPDRMVRKNPPLGTPWPSHPLPILAIEATSQLNRRDDLVRKREIYLRLGIPEYWILDVDARVVWVCKPNEPDVEVRDTLRWRPADVPEGLLIDVEALFARD